MAYGYWKLGRSEQNAIFHLFFRRPPFQGGYAIAAGLQPALEFLQKFRFESDDLAYLETLLGNDGKRIFEAQFLDYLSGLSLTCNIDAIPEGTVVFGHEPLLRVEGPILQCQLLETALLNVINFQTLVATKAARICGIAGEQSVLEFGLRRAQGVDGGLAASRAAYLGGCAATSNVLAGKLYGIPVKGTHAHSWVMSFDSENEAFSNYAEVLPNNCVFLVDTFDTLEGVNKAISIGRSLRSRGHEMVGIRLDSGDLAQLSIEARRLLDEAGFESAAIIASNDLDEFAIERLQRDGAKIAVWGVGTKLATAYDQPALGGVYKLGAFQAKEGNWIPKIKLSEQRLKTSIPGKLQVRRYFHEANMIADVIFDERQGFDRRQSSVKLAAPEETVPLSELGEGEDLLVPVMRDGEVREVATLESARERAAKQLGMLSAGCKELTSPASYPVLLDIGLHELRESLIQANG